MYEELVERLRHDSESRALMHEAADAIEELGKLLDGVSADNDSLCEKIERMVIAGKPRWIPVTEPPKDDGWYQVYAPGYSGGSSSGLKNVRGNMYSAFKNGKWSIEVGYHKRPGCVKAWMPLPKPPKEEA